MGLPCQRHRLELCCDFPSPSLPMTGNFSSAGPTSEPLQLWGWWQGGVWDSTWTHTGEGGVGRVSLEAAHESLQVAISSLCWERSDLTWILVFLDIGVLGYWYSSGPPLWSLWIILGWNAPVICKFSSIRGKISCAFFPVHRIAFSPEEKIRAWSQELQMHLQYKGKFCLKYHGPGTFSGTQPFSWASDLSSAAARTTRDWFCFLWIELPKHSSYKTQPTPSSTQTRGVLTWTSIPALQNIHAHAANSQRFPHMHHIKYPT